jgi:tRNA modification GTPase
MDEETIVALATPPGRAGVAVVRLSGSRSEGILRRLVSPLPERLHARRCYHGFLHDGQRRIDECLALLFRAPHSYSGEDMAEVSLHANPFLVEALLGLACRHGARPALAGEFTYRAFRHGKLDLLQAEAVNELIQANSRAYSRMEFDNLEGRLSREIGEVREALLRAAADVETRIEFAEDQRVEAEAASGGLGRAAAILDAILASSRFADILNRGLSVVIAGRVNVGKSSLFTALLLRERSIISEHPGTTRDYIEEPLLVAGAPIRLTDVAGIRADAAGDAEDQGIRRSLERIEAADAVILVLDASQPLQAGDLEIYRRLGATPRLLLANKCDLEHGRSMPGIRAAFANETVQWVSAKTGENLEAVAAFLADLLRRMPDASGAAAVNRRQRGLLEKLQEQVGLVMRLQAEEREPVELVAEEIRQGLRLVAELTGEAGADDVLQRIFASFCIGK